MNTTPPLNLTRNTPLFFKKLPSTENSSPNAHFVRDMGILKQEPVCEITYRNDKWIVRYSEVLPVQMALSETAKKWQAIIDGCEDGATKEQIARAMNCSVGTLRNRMKLIQNHLPKTVNETEAQETVPGEQCQSEDA